MRHERRVLHLATPVKHIAKRVRFFADAESQAPEVFLVRAIVNDLEATSEAYNYNYNCDHTADDDRKEAEALNAPRKR